MRILYLGNNLLGWKVLSWLCEQNEVPVGIVVHPEEHRGSRYGTRIMEYAQKNSIPLFEGSKLRQEETIEEIKALNADIALSVLFRYILKPNVINLFSAGVVNLHPAYLPFNRGAFPNVWSIVDNSPAGVTLHYIDEDIDTGDIIARLKVPIEPTDTGETLYHKLEVACLALFQETWPLINSGRASRDRQEKKESTFHLVKDVDKIDLINLDETYSARYLINLIRARTFQTYPGAYFIEDGRKVYLRLELLDEDQIQ